MEPAIAITGVGVISPIGTGREAFAEGLLAGRCAVGPITRFESGPVAGGLGAEIADFDPAPYLGSKGLRRIDRTSLLAGSAARLAIDDAGLEEVYPPERTGVALGSTFGVIDNICFFDRDALEDGPAYVNPMDFPNTVYNAPASRIAIFCKITGPTSTISTGNASALDALLYGADFLRIGRAKVFLVGGAYGLNPDTLWVFHRSGLLAGSSAGTSEKSAPYGKSRSGFLLGEGAGILTMERLDDAGRRGASVKAVLSGAATCYGSSGSVGLRPAATSGARAAELAIADAGLSPGDIGLVVGGANGSPMGDLAEAQALGSVFGPRLAEIPLLPLKALTGECLDASGAFQLMSALVCLEKGIPAISLDWETDPACGLLKLDSGQKAPPPAHALVLSLSGTGGAAAAVLSRPSS